MTIKVLTRFMTIALCAVLLALAITPASAQQAQEEAEPAAISILTNAELPGKAVRVREQSVPATLTETMQALMKTAGSQVRQGETEVLAWTGSGYKKSQANALMNQMAKAMQGSNWKYEASPQSDGAFLLVTALRTNPTRKGIIGFWVPTDEALILVWTEMLPAATDDSTARPEAMSEDAGDAPVAAPPPATSTNNAHQDHAAHHAPAPGGAVPAEMIGDWRWTTISGSNYVDSTTGRITDNAGGMSAAFTFEKDGHYKFNFYVRQRTYGLVTESTTTHEGTVTFEAGKFILHPIKGYYRGSSTGGKIVDRPMTLDEMKKSNVYFWRWETTGGKRQLKMGPSEPGLSIFQREK